MITPKDILNEALTWIDTPYIHQARLKGVGVDCIGVIVGVAKSLGLSDFDVFGYSKSPNGFWMRRQLDSSKDVYNVNINDRQIGDIGLFAFSRFPQHLGIISEIGVIHSSEELGKCVDEPLSINSGMKLISTYRFVKVE